MVNCPTCAQSWPYPPTKCGRCDYEDDSPEIEPFGMFYIIDDQRPTIEAALPDVEEVWTDANGTEQRRVKSGRTITLIRRILCCQECWLEHKDDWKRAG
jgi:hypothetical protein